MKTQISHLINGAKNVIRDENHKKYTTAKQATSHIGYAGSNYNKRQEIAARVHCENGDNLRINIRGVELTLELNHSTTGKTWWYECALTQDQYSQICQTSLGIGANINEYHLYISSSCFVEVRSFHAVREGQTLKQGYSPYIDEAFVTIL